VCGSSAIKASSATTSITLPRRCAVVVFQLITLPTEFNASNRAKAVLASTGIVSTQQEADGVKRVLDAAALTYVAAAAASLLQLIDLVLRQRR
jgi:Zn-dependent membrane protease YugP